MKRHQLDIICSYQRNNVAKNRVSSPGMVLSQARLLSLYRSDDIFVAVMGMTGTGKSTFISRITKDHDISKGDCLISCKVTCFFIESY